jgi:tetratricopeptide (TPR) repeat protein
MASSYPTDIDDVEMSCKGMQLLLNNDLDACQALFDQYRYYSPLMSGGWSFVSFMRAVISFDDQRLTQAGRDLAETEKLCAHETTTKFTRTIQPPNSKTITYEESLVRRIVIADCKLYQAILTLIKQELSSLIGAGLLLRKAWKVYEKLHNELFDLYRAKDPNAEKDYGSKQEENMSIQFEDTNGTNNDDDDDELSFKSFASNDTNDELSLYTIKRLLGSASFGYGLFQIALSFVPPKIMRLIKFLGFEGDRKAALAALRFSSQSTDMKAPLANLTLLWYHCVIQPFFAIDISNPPDMSEAKSILKRNIDKYDKSTLFIYFQGRLERIEKDLPKALATFLSGLNASNNQSQNTTIVKVNELDQILVYDLGFCYLMMLNFERALFYFTKLKEESRWSKAFYCYICAVCTAAMNDPKASANFVKDGIKLLQKRSNPVELFVQKRLDYLKKYPPSVSSAYILVFEMLYLWILLPSCEVPTLQKMLQIVEKHGRDSKDDSKLRPITCFIEGAIHNILVQVDDAQNCYEEALVRVDDSKLIFTRYILPFANCELGILEYLYRQNTERAKELLTKAKEKYADYDFDNRLQIRAAATLKMITSRETAATTAAASDK